MGAKINALDWTEQAKTTICELGARKRAVKLSHVRLHSSAN